ncbi:PP2C family protein-serine/threonine phosphatase [Amycolatopsis sp. NPDC059657]|uniref:PP2C family protein-serine/threonine phosphatase n=1 Tax=Amycolatopsis sp. NPDC059657 TaxID=3346899 RepID=UPI00366C2BD4
MSISAAAGNEIGNRYRENYDVAHLGVEPLLAIVADGMGDGRGSAMAGRTTVGTMVELLKAPATAESVREAVAAAQRRVGEIGAQLGELTGCTLTALVPAADGFLIAQVGDSRVYRLREGLLELLTTDHTMAWLGAVHGWYPFDSPQASAARYQLTRYIGHPARPEPDVLTVFPRPGDVFLLCTDGIAEQVPYHRMLEILSLPKPPEELVRQLLADAEAAGGRDNATAIVVRV